MSPSIQMAKYGVVF